MALNYVQMTGDLGAAAAAAQATFTASNWLTDATDELLIPPEPVTFNLSAAGTFATLLLATDNPAPLPAGWSWQASFQLPGINANTFSFFLPAGPYAFTATHGTPATFTASAATFINGTGVQLTGGLPGGFGSATTYYVTAASGHTFGLAATNGGSALPSTSTGSGSALTVSTDISSVAQYSAAPSVLAYLPLPSGTPASGYVPVATGTGEASVWTAGGGGGGAVDSVTAGDASITIGGSTVFPTVETGTLDKIASLHPAGTAVTLNSQKITNLANGSASTDAAAFGQIPSLPLSIANGGTGVTARDWAGLLTPASVQTSAYNANPGDFVPCDTTSGAFTVTLPTAPADLTVIGIKMVTQGGSNAVTFATGGSDVFNKTGGGTTGTLSLASQGVIVQYKASGAIWYVYSDDLPLSQLKNLFGFSVITLTDASVIAVNAALGSMFRVTLTGNHTLGLPSNPNDGQAIVFEIIQDGTGSRTLAYAAGYSFPSSIGTPVLSSSAGFHDFLAFRYDSGTTTWYCVGFVPQSVNATPWTVAQGGTGQSSLTPWTLLAGGTASTSAVQQVSIGTAGQLLMSNGAGSLPTFESLDATASDIALVGTTLAAGSNGKPADSGHVHATPSFLPADFGYAAWTNDPGVCNATNTAGTSLMWLVKFAVRQGTTLNDVYLHVVTAPSGSLTNAQNYACVYDSGGTQRAITADQSGVWNTTGVKESAFTSSYTAPAGSYYLVVNMVVSGGSGPQFRAATSTGNAFIANAGLSGATLRYATQTAAAGTPPTLNYASNVQTSAAPICGIFV